MSGCGEGCGVDVLEAVVDRLLMTVDIVGGDEFTRVATGETTTGMMIGWSDDNFFVGCVVFKAVATFTDGEEDFGFGCGVVGVGFGALIEGVLWRS